MKTEAEIRSIEVLLSIMNLSIWGMKNPTRSSKVAYYDREQDKICTRERGDRRNEK
jgi:hypothetical protein